MAETENDRAFRQAKLGSAIIQVEQGNAGLRRHPNRGRANVHLGSGILIGPEVIAAGQRPIGDHVQPIALATRLKSDSNPERSSCAPLRREDPGHPDPDLAPPILRGFAPLAVAGHGDATVGQVDVV